MKRTILIIVGVLGIAGAAYWGITSRSGGGLEAMPAVSDRPGRDGQRIARFQDAEVGLQFDYRTSPDGYIVLDRDSADGSPDAPLRELVLFLKTEYEALLRDEGLPREGPPGINIQVFNPGPNITPEEWAARYPERSNFRTGTPITWETIDGNSAARYSWDGLYQGQTVVIARKGWVYMLTVSYADAGMLRDFNELLLTLRLQR